jgi:hypothetical protein
MITKVNTMWDDVIALTWKLVDFHAESLWMTVTNKYVTGKIITLLSPRSRFIVLKLMFLQQVKKFPAFLVPEFSPPRSQDLTNLTFPQPDQSISRNPISIY